LLAPLRKFQVLITYKLSFFDASWKVLTVSVEFYV